MSISVCRKRLLSDTTVGVVGTTGGRHEPESRVVDRSGTTGGAVSLRGWDETDHPHRGPLRDVALPRRVHPLHRHLRSAWGGGSHPALRPPHPPGADSTGGRGSGRDHGWGNGNHAGHRG